MKMQITRLVLLAAALAVVRASLVVKWRFDNDLQRARAHAAQGGVLLPTRCGPIEYQKSGLRCAFAGALAKYGIRIIAMSRFGYLRTPTPPELLAHASPPERAQP